MKDFWLCQLYMYVSQNVSSAVSTCIVLPLYFVVLFKEVSDLNVTYLNWTRASSENSAENPCRSITRYGCLLDANPVNNRGRPLCFFSRVDTNISYYQLGLPMTICWNHYKYAVKFWILLSEFWIIETLTQSFVSLPLFMFYVSLIKMH